MSFIYLKLRGRERTYIKEKVKYMCVKILYDPVDMTAILVAFQKHEHMKNTTRVRASKIRWDEGLPFVFAIITRM